MNDSSPNDTELVLLKENNHGEGHVATIVKENVRMPQRTKTHEAKERQPSDSEPGHPAKPGRPPWVWALVGIGAVVAIGAGVAYYLYSLSYESTDDAFVDGHIIPVSARAAGYVAKVYVTDNQWVNQGDLLAELDPRDYEARLAASEAALAAARAGRKSHSIGVDVTEITSSAGVGEASAAVEGAKAAVETARAAVATAKSQQARPKPSGSGASRGRSRLRPTSWPPRRGNSGPAVI